MDSHTFWSIVDKSRQAAAGEPDAHIETLRTALKQLDADEIVEFDRIFREHLARAYTWGLWGAAYVIGDGCSDDGFAYFRAWLISKGQAVYEAALLDPDSLADVVSDVDGDAQFEEFTYVASQAWEEKLNKRFDEFPRSEIDSPANPSGKPWDEDGEELEERFPELWARFVG